MKDVAYKLEVEFNSKMVSSHMRAAIEEAMLEAGRLVKMKMFLLSDPKVGHCSFKKWDPAYSSDTGIDGYVEIPLNPDYPPR